MKKTIFTSLMLIPVLSACSYEKELKAFEHKAALINKYENVALKLAKENRELRAEVKRLEFEIEKLKQDSAFKKLGHAKDNGHKEVTTHVANTHDVESKHSEGRTIASVAPKELDLKKDLVEYKTYKWSADDMLKIADKEFKAKNFEKAAQFYSSLINYYPQHHSINDEFYFKAGISSYESGSHHEWTLEHFDALMTKYPTSQYFRSAKLWVALTHMKLGKKDKFFATVEEFRKKYRNTNEWKILSSYYEKIEEKTNE